MSKHTKEPWKISIDDSTEEWSIVTNLHGSIIANVNEETGPELVGSAPVIIKMPGLENARRIVACVNACIGIRTEALEHRAHMLKAADDDIAQLAAQRDELLEALEKLTQSGLALITVDGVDDREDAATIESNFNDDLIFAQETIAKAKGGAK